jgi:hypothetical protein
MAGLNNIGNILSSQIENIMREYGQKTVEDIKRILMKSRKRINTARLINSVKYEIVKDRFVILMKDYGKFVDYGVKGHMNGSYDGFQPKKANFVKQQVSGGLLKLTPIKKGAFFYYTTPNDRISGKKFSEAIDSWILQKLGRDKYKKYRFLIRQKIWRFGVAPRPFIFKVEDNFNKAQEEIKKRVSFGIKITVKK